MLQKEMTLVLAVQGKNIKNVVIKKIKKLETENVVDYLVEALQT